jgi:hypothetical protein
VSLENSDGIHTPSRRALLRTAVAGGAFAVPLIASFSMDSASAQTKAQNMIVSNMVVSNMLCSNMTRVPNAVFFAELRRAGGTGSPVGPVLGFAGFEFVRGRDELSYQFLFAGKLSDFIITGGNAGFVLVTTSNKVDQIPESTLNCGSSGLSTLYEAFASGQANLEVQLTDGVNLIGTIRHLGPGGPVFGF